MGSPGIRDIKHHSKFSRRRQKIILLLRDINFAALIGSMSMIFHNLEFNQNPIPLLKNSLMKTFISGHSFIILMIIMSGRIMNLSAQDSESMAPGMAPVIPVPGYVILSSGDTLPGKLRWALKYVENNPVEIKFTAENGASKSFTANDIKGFGNQLKIWMEDNPKAFLMDTEHYVSIPSFKKGVPVFMNRLLNGRLTIYQNRSAMIIGSTTTIDEVRTFDGIGFTFTIGEGLSIGPSYRTDYQIIKGRARFTSYFVIKDGAPMIKVDKDNYESLFKTLFSDCEAIDREIAKNPDLNKFKNFMILAEVYNNLCN
jgi:hypothetical protein